jgi:hypothetical protein
LFLFLMVQIAFSILRYAQPKKTASDQLNFSMAFCYRRLIPNNISFSLIISQKLILFYY